MLGDPHLDRTEKRRRRRREKKQKRERETRKNLSLWRASKEWFGEETIVFNSFNHLHFAIARMKVISFDLSFPFK